MCTHFGTSPPCSLYIEAPLAVSATPKNGLVYDWVRRRDRGKDIHRSGALIGACKPSKSSPPYSSLHSFCCVQWQTQQQPESYNTSRCVLCI